MIVRAVGICLAALAVHALARPAAAPFIYFQF